MIEGATGGRLPSKEPAPSSGSGACRILGIETSCDETAAAVVEDGRHVISSVVSSQVDLHARFGGVVPELAGRAHVELLTAVIGEALAGAGMEVSGRIADPHMLGGPRAEPGQTGLTPAGSGRCGSKPSVGELGIDAVAATSGPGLVGSLLVGVSEAKALALVWGVPFVAVNHLEAHLYAAIIEEPDLELPLMVLLVSGGHTMLVSMEGPGRYRLVGQTLDDAAGEAFDKVARYIGLGYPGGPAIDEAARNGDPGSVPLPRAMMGDGYDFSFSGLKTAVVQYVRSHPEVSSSDVAASFQQAVVDVLVAKSRRAARSYGSRGLCLAGGVAANSLLRETTVKACSQDGIRAFVPSRAMCTDNAAMVAAAGFFKLRSNGADPLGTGADPGLALSLLS